MQRIPEPELMNDLAQVDAYANADFEQPHAFFINTLLQIFTDTLTDIEHEDCYALDLGCGPGDITRRFVRAVPGCMVHAVDGAANMIATAERLNHTAGLEQRIQLFTTHLGQDRLPRAQYDFVFSNSLLHHLHDAKVLWQSIKQSTGPGAGIFVMDLMRPQTTDEATQWVATYAANEPEILKQDFYHSLCAAYRIDEVRAQLQDNDLQFCTVEQISDRHLIIHGVCP